MQKINIWFILIPVLVMNIVAFAAFAIDKRRARRGAYRISEKTLLTLSACFGALGALLAMQIFRHKTRHKIFFLCVPLLLIVQLLITGYLLI